METPLKLDSIDQHLLNNAELEFFIHATVSNILDVGYVKLGIPKEIFDAFNANDALFSNIVSQSRVSSLTAKIAEADRKCDALLRYFFDLLDNGRHLPMDAEREAYIKLYDATTVYRGILRLPQLQQIAQTRGLVLDVSSAGLSEYIVQLKLTSLVQAIDNANVEFALLVDDRREAKSDHKLPSTGVVRREILLQYGMVMTIVNAKQMTDPTAETESFISRQNALIAEVKARYNLRMGLLHHYKDQKEQEESDPTQG